MNLSQRPSGFSEGLTNPQFHNRRKPMKYHVELSSGRDFIMETEGSVYDIAYDAYEEACLMDDYLVNVTPICDV